MHLQELFEIQAGLKGRIGYYGPDKFEKMMLAMIIEFAEAANDWQGFKYWKLNSDPKPTLLEEYVDGLHFVLEAGLDLLDGEFIRGLPVEFDALTRPNKLSITGQFKQIIYDALMVEVDIANNAANIENRYFTLFGDYLRLGELLGFTEDQIKAEYLRKNAVNHERQDSGY